MHHQNPIVALSAVRTPIGRFGGTLKDVSVLELGGIAVQEAIQRAGISPQEIEEVVLGNCRQAGNGPNPCRSAALLGGIPVDVPASTLNMACPSGMKAIMNAAQSIQTNTARLVVAGGMDSMSTIPHMVRGLRFAPKKMGDIVIEDGWKDATDPIAETTMGQTAERLAQKHQITREVQDRYALHSHQKAVRATKDGLFSDEIVPIRLAAAFKHGPVELHSDETPRENTSIEKLAALPPAFSRTGSVTAGNSSTMSDGACALVLTSQETAREGQWTPVFKIVGAAQCAVDGEVMGEGPVLSIEKVLRQTGMTLNDMDIIEINEAFASQIVTNIQQLTLDENKLNVHGGAIALGHPTGISGARIVVTLAHALRTYDKQFGLAAICGAGGVTTAMIIERM
ncbi:MAG: thiolase family protein [Deltaproteobacteria bacterium]|nr:thiolase family protein [Deltaproteobacteria bacterium]MBN2674770.1 thiolase family protein [Deltaproteobacteria bacterium]